MTPPKVTFPPPLVRVTVRAAVSAMGKLMVCRLVLLLTMLPVRFSATLPLNV